MNMKKHKNLSLICACVIFISMISGCSENAKSPKGTGEPQSATVPIAEQPTTSPEPTATQKPLDFTWKTHVYSETFRKVYGGETEKVYYTFIDAILNGSECFACPDEETMYTISTIAGTCFPPFVALISDLSYKDGAVFLSFALNAEQHKQVLDQFEKQIAMIIQSAVVEGDSPEMATISLYHSYSGMITYDYVAVDNDVIVDVSCYRALTELTGICQSFAGAYAYLCLQCGIEAVSVGGMTEAFEAHEWTMLTLDDQYYYMDPTFENATGGTGLRYFGMTALQRELEGGFIADEYNIGNTNVLWGREIDVVAERFAPLWEATNIIDMERKNGILHIQCERIDGTQFTFVVE